MAKSTDGGRHWSRAQRILPATDLCVAFEPSIGRCVMDGIGGARDDLGPSPSVDIANGARPAPTPPTRSSTPGRTRDGLNREDVLFATSTDGEASWTARG